MLSLLQKNLPALCLLLTTLLGLALGSLGAAVTGAWLRPAVLPARAAGGERPAPARKPLLTDYQVILQRNIFDSTASGSGTLSDTQAPGTSTASTAPRPNLTLLGTVVAGARSLAVIQTGQETKTFRADAELPGGGRIEEIGRHHVRIKNPDGRVETLQLYSGETSRAASPAAAGSGSGIQEVGKNRWAIPRSVAEQARDNMNELLKQARMEPNLVAGRMDGFVVRMIRPKSLLDTLGIQRGDVLVQVNGMPLDSPEKALQIFQQLREVRHLSISLQRNGTPMNFEYEVE